MKTDLTDITLVIDRSGSMASIQSDAEGGVNSFITEQAKHPGEALLTLVQFDTEYEFLHRGVPIGKIPHFQLVPRGSTALLDAMGRAINETGERLAKLAEADRPGLVIVVIMTDGQENSSREFNREQIRKMVEHQQSKYNWRFIYLGANQDAFAEAQGMGIPLSAAANFDAGRVANAFDGTMKAVMRMRSLPRESLSPDVFTKEEREGMQE